METAEMNEEIQKIITKNKTRIIFYKNTVLLKGLYETIVCSKAYTSDEHIFYETKINEIYKIKKQRFPKKIGNGKLLGIVDETIVWENKGNIFVHNNNMTKKAIFNFYKDNTAEYKNLEIYTSTSNDREIYKSSNDREIYKSSNDREIYLKQDICGCVYMEYLVMTVNNILYFLSLRNKETVKYKKDKEIMGIEVKSVKGINLLWIYGWECYFYQNEEVSEDKGGIWSWGWIEIELFKELNPLEQILVLNMWDISTIALEEAFLKVIGKTKTISKFIEKINECKNKRDIFENQKTNNNEINSNIKEDVKKIPILFSMTNYRGIDFFKKYYSENTTIKLSLFVEKTIFSLVKFNKKKLFYNDIFPVENFIEKTVINEKSVEFLENKYKRIFSYDKKIQSNSNNLAYKTIAIIQKHSKNRQFPKITKKIFFSALHKIFKDARGDEIFDILTENSIIFDKNSFDFEAIRMECFKYRTFACAGSLLLPSGKWGFKYSLKLFSNRSDFLKDFDKNILFYFFAANHNAIIETTSENNKIVALASGFGKNITLPETSLQIYDLIGMLNPNLTKDNPPHYVLLALASAFLSCSKGQFVADMDTNRAFLTYLRKKDMAAKLTAISCLAIYNFNSQNRNIFSTLLEQCRMSGPMIHEERCLDYYTSQYRAFAAVSAATVYNVKSPVFLDDKFAELLVNGLSFIGTSIFSSYMKRDSSARPSEIFYGELFYLLNSFSLSVDDARNLISDLLFSRNTRELYQINILAAHIFYIALKIFKDQISIEDNLHNWFYKIIDHSEKLMLKNQNYKVFFDFSLIAFSLILNSSFDLRLLTIIRRQILATRDPYNIPSENHFNMSTKSMLTYYGPGFESIHYYKICMAIVCAGLGTLKLNLSNIIDFKIIILTFFYSDLPLFLFRQIDYFKFFLPRVFVSNTSFIKKIEHALKKYIQKRLRKKISRKFWQKFDKKSVFDKKYIIDVFSDFIENYSTKTNRNLFDLNSFVKIITVTK